MSVSTRIVKPTDCILAFGIPTDEAGFRADRKRPDKDFAKRFSSWARYDNEFVGHLETVEPALLGLGVRVVHQLTLVQLRELIDTSDVFILFSHWLDKRVELWDGLWDVTEVVNAVPIGYSRILDLCVCRSEPLVSTLRTSRPGCLIRHVAEREVIPRVWLFFFLVLFKYLNNQPATYLEGIEAVIGEFLKDGREKQ